MRWISETQKAPSAMTKQQRCEKKGPGNKAVDKMRGSKLGNTGRGRGQNKCGIDEAS